MYLNFCSQLYLLTPGSVIFEMFGRFLPNNAVKDYREVCLFAKLGKITERFFIERFRLKTGLFVRKTEVEFFFQIIGSLSFIEDFYRQFSL